MDLKHCRICDAPGAYEDGGQSIEEHIAVGSTDPWCECECCGNTERYHDWQDSEPLDSPLRRQLAAANEKLTAAGRLAQDTQEQVATLSADLVGANERAGWMEKALRRAVDDEENMAAKQAYASGLGVSEWPSFVAPWFNNAREALEVRDDDDDA